MTDFTAIDLSQLPAPDVIESLDYETILSELVGDFSVRYPEHATGLESDPVAKLLEAAAYRELLLRARVNDAARAVMLASARGADLDQLGAWWGVARLETDPGDPDAVPPVAPSYQTDAVYRAQIQASLERYTSAGSIGAYQWHAVRADPHLLDVGVDSPDPGIVRVVVLASSGVPTQGQLDAVTSALNAEVVRPLCDTVIVQASTLVTVDVTATLYLGTGPDADVVEAAARAALTAYLAEQRRVGARVAVSGIHAALHQVGVQYVTLSTPMSDVIAAATQAPWPGTITLSTAQTSV